MEDFVNFETAKTLKDKGFREECLYCYRNRDGKLFANPLYNKDATETYITTNELLYSHNSKVESRIIAPTISQVLEWLRKEKKISVEPVIHCSLKWRCDIYGFSDRLVDFTQYSNDGIDDTVFIFYDSYEQAALAGIEYVLDNLI